MWLFHFCYLRGERSLFLPSMTNSHLLLGVCLLSDLFQRCLLTLETLLFCSEWCAKPSVGHCLIIVSICKYSSDEERWVSAHPVCSESLALFPLQQWHRGMNNSVCFCAEWLSGSCQQLYPAARGCWEEQCLHPEEERQVSSF